MDKNLKSFHILRNKQIRQIMSKKHLVIKSTGEQEFFEPEKLANSLRKSGADNKSVDIVMKALMSWIYEGATTKEIYRRAFNALRKFKNSSAARYSLKKSIMELGPSGFPFEHFIGQLLRKQGFDIQVGVQVQGQCIQHEVDVVATANGKQYLVECKFYNTQGKFASVQVPLYIHSRVNDIIKKRVALPQYMNLQFFGWIVTNTRFTTDAIDYGKCAGLHLMGWDYPNNHSLKDMVENNGLYPVTALTSLEKIYKNELLNKGVVLCSQLFEDKSILKSMSIKDSKLKQINQEIEDLCELI